MVTDTVNINPTTAITTSSFNGLKTPHGKATTARAHKKQEPTTYYIQEIHFKRKDTKRLKGHGDRHTMLILTERKLE